jgi:Tol biopolymer transport system component
LLVSRRERESYEIGPGFKLVERLRVPYRLAYARAALAFEVVVHDLGTGKGRLLFQDAGGHSFCPLAWSSDGRTVFHSYRGEVVALDVDDGTSRRVTSFDDEAKRASIYWQLQCSPDGERLLFMRNRGFYEGHPPEAWGHVVHIIYSVRTDGTDLREVCAIPSVQNFACSWRHNLLLVTTSGKQPALWRMDLEGRNAERVCNGALFSDLQVAPDGEHAVYHLQSGAWSRDLRTGDVERIVEWGKVPALSPDGKVVAFMREDHEVYLQRIGGPVEPVVVGRNHDGRWRGGSSRYRPVWSPDGRLLFLRATIGKRHATPQNPEHVAKLREAKALAEQSSAQGVPSRVRVGYDQAIEDAHWSFDASVGVVDFHIARIRASTRRIEARVRRIRPSIRRMHAPIRKITVAARRPGAVVVAPYGPSRGGDL